MTHLSQEVTFISENYPVLKHIYYTSPGVPLNEIITTIIVKVISSPNSLEKLDRVINRKWKIFNTFLNKTNYSIPVKRFTIEIYIHPNITETNLLKIKKHRLYLKYSKYIRQWELNKNTLNFYNEIEKSCIRKWWDNYFFSEVFRRKNF